MSVSLSWEVSDMELDDLREVIEIEDLSGLSRWGYEAYHRELMSNPSAIMLVARSLSPEEDGRNVLGFLASWIVADEMHLNNIATHPDFRDRGVAKDLLGEALLIARAQEARFCILEVRVSNLSAMRLYEAFRFEPVGRRAGYYSNPVEDALVMKLDFRSTRFEMAP